MESLLLQFPRVGGRPGIAIPADSRAWPVLDVHNVITSARQTPGMGSAPTAAADRATARSFREGIATLPGDASVIAAAPFRIPLRNSLAVDAAADIAVRGL